MHRPHVPIERDIAGFVARYRERGGDEGEIICAIGRAFPGVTYGAIGRALALAQATGGAHDRAS